MLGTSVCVYLTGVNSTYNCSPIALKLYSLGVHTLLQRLLLIQALL